jgi:hypothetical protein
LPAYAASPFASPGPMLMPGVIGYSFGKKPYNVPDTRMRVTSVAISANVAMLGVTLVEGLAPTVGSLISVQGTQSGAGEFNVTNVALTGVSGFNTGNNDTGTVTFALTGANLTTTPDAGQAIVPVPAVGDAIAPGNKGQQFAIQSQSGGNKQKGFTWFTEFGGTAPPSAVMMHLQFADRDIDADYTTYDTSVVVGETRSLGNITANFVRVIAETITGGTSPTCISGIMPS